MCQIKLTNMSSVTFELFLFFIFIFFRFQKKKTFEYSFYLSIDSLTIARRALLA